VLPKAGLLLSSIYLAWSVRAVASNFNESRFLGFALYSTFFAVIFLGPFAWLSGADPQMLLVMAVLLVLLVYAIPILIIFLPKLLSIWLWNKDGAKQALGIDLPRGALEGSSTNTLSGGNSTGGRSGLRSPTNAGKMITGSAPGLVSGSGGTVRSMGAPNSALGAKPASKGSKASNNVGGDKYVYVPSAAPGNGAMQSQERELSGLSQTSNMVRPLLTSGNSARKVPRPSVLSSSRGGSDLGEPTVGARPTAVQLSVRSFGQTPSPKVSPTSGQILPGQTPVGDDEELMLGAAAGGAAASEDSQRGAPGWPSSPSGAAVGARARDRSATSSPVGGAPGSARGESTIALTSSHSASSVHPAAAALPAVSDHLIAAERGTLPPQHGTARSPHPMATTQQHAPLFAEAHRRQHSISGSNSGGLQPLQQQNRHAQS